MVFVEFQQCFYDVVTGDWLIRLQRNWRQQWERPMDATLFQRFLVSMPLTGSPVLEGEWRSLSKGGGGID